MFQNAEEIYHSGIVSHQKRNSVPEVHSWPLNNFKPFHLTWIWSLQKRKQLIRISEQNMVIGAEHRMDFGAVTKSRIVHLNFFPNVATALKRI